MQRRGSHSANMLKPTVAIIQGEQQQQHQPKRFDSSNRRSSLPMVPTFGQSTTTITPQAPAIVIPLPQNNSMQWPLQQQRQGFAQPQSQQASTRHSFASSMDLISPAITASSSLASSGSGTFPNNNLFKSSSHHTSHTAAAGDLLTMSRRAFDPPLPNQINAVTKKRSSTETDATSVAGNSSGQQFNFTSMNRSISTGGQHQQQSMPFGNSLQFVPNNPHVTSSFGSGHGSASYVSSSTVGAGDNEDSYQEHRTIRQCRRSDSFEMMNDD